MTVSSGTEMLSLFIATAVAAPALVAPFVYRNEGLVQNVADEKVAVRAGRHPGKIGFAVVERRRHPEIFEKPVQTQFIVIAEFGHRHRNGAAFEAAERLQRLRR